MYHMPKKQVDEYFKDGVVEGSKADGSIVVIDRKQFMQKYIQYKTDPSVREIAKKYTGSDSRKDLLKEGTKKEPPHRKGGIKNTENEQEIVPGNPEDINLNVSVEEKNSLKGFNPNAAICWEGEYDPLNVDVEKLRAEYNQELERQAAKKNAVQPKV